MYSFVSIFLSSFPLLLLSSHSLLCIQSMWQCAQLSSHENKYSWLKKLKEPRLICNICHDKMLKDRERREWEKKQTRNLSRMPPWLLSTPLIVSGSVEDATFFSPLLSIWCHRKWNFISYSAAITLDRAHQDKADSYLQICLSCGTINHCILTILQTCFSRQLLVGVCTVNWLLQGSQGLWYAMLALLFSL